MKLDCSFREIAEAVGGTSNCSNLINAIIIDSRKPLRGDDVLFVALSGPNNDGHQYIPELIKEGITHFLVNDSFDITGLEANFIQVADSLDGLQKIAGWHRKRFDYPVIGITGSAGKTSVKEWLYHLLKSEFNIVRSPKSYNSQVGVPLSIFEMTADHDLAIIEVGISKPGEMARQARMLNPTHGILTTLGKAHLHNFDSPVALALEKRKLFTNCEFVIDGTEVEQNNAVRLVHSDKAAIHNASVCLEFIKRLLPDRWEELLPNFEKLERLALRLEIQKGINENTIVNDSYNSDLSGLEIALDLASHQHKNELILILSDIDSDLISKDGIYKEAADIINRYEVAKTFGVGQEVEALGLHLKSFTCYPTVDALASGALLEIENSCILLKGARDFKFEKIGRILQEKHHETVLEINLAAIEHNLNVFKSMLNGAKIMAMVKAFAYGSGDVEVAKVMQRQGVDALGVANTDEGINLRKAGIDIPIMIMNAEPSAFKELIEYNLEPVIYNERILDAFVRALINYDHQNYPIHLELETGMNRLGARFYELPDLCAQINSQPEVKIASIFSHLAVSEDASEDEFTFQQIERFIAGTTKIEQALGYSITKHICNTGGILRFPEAHFDMVRLGIGVYGVDPTSTKKYGLEPVGTLKTALTQIREFKDTETVGYGRSGAANRGERIGIIPIGYADGLRRSLSNGQGEVWVNGKFAPIVGKICMDMTMINLTGIDCKEGDSVEVFGPNIPVEVLAKKMGTIPYELLTSISARVKRTYIND